MYSRQKNQHKFIRSRITDCSMVGWCYTSHIFIASGRTFFFSVCFDTVRLDVVWKSLFAVNHLNIVTTPHLTHSTPNATTHTHTCLLRRHQGRSLARFSRCESTSRSRPGRFSKGCKMVSISRFVKRHNRLVGEGTNSCCCAQSQTQTQSS